MTDGTYKKVNRNRGGDVEPLTAEIRRDFDDTWYGIHEVQPKIGPDGLVVTTPYYEPTSPARLV